MPINTAVFNSSGPCTVNNMQENEDGTWTLTATVSDLEIEWYDSFGDPHTLPTSATFTVTVPTSEMPANFIRESLFNWLSTYTVKCSGFYMTD